MRDEKDRWCRFGTTRDLFRYQLGALSFSLDITYSFYSVEAKITSGKQTQLVLYEFKFGSALIGNDQKDKYSIRGICHLWTCCPTMFCEFSSWWLHTYVYTSKETIAQTARRVPTMKFWKRHRVNRFERLLRNFRLIVRVSFVA